MSTLLLLRHARAAWPEGGTGDFDRRLTESGRKDIRAIAQAMLRQGLLPEAVICSTARRAQETWLEVAEVLAGKPMRVEHSDALYNSDASTYLEIVIAAAPVATLMLIGHNPMLEDLACALAGSGKPGPLAAMRRGLPAAGLAVISFDGELGDIRPGTGWLEEFLVAGPQMSSG